MHAKKGPDCVKRRSKILISHFMNTFIEAFLMENQMRKKFKCNDMHYYRPEDRKMSPKPSVARIRPSVLQSNNTYMLQPVAVQILGLSNSYVEK